jgi:hypothetical protein
MRGKERFSAPGKESTLTVRFSAGLEAGAKAHPRQGTAFPLD